jgi:predicted metal-dependent phosphoesterase TrpH
VGTADLHAHTCQDSWADGNQTVEELFRYVQDRTNLDIFGITDHDNADTARHAWEVYSRGSYRFGFLPGVEVTNQAGHLLCYFPNGEIFDVPSLRPFWWTVRYAQERGALCIPAHPVYPPWLARSILTGLQGGKHLAAVEAINAGISERAQEKLDTIAERLAPLAALVGNSDAHHDEAIGSAYTRFPGTTVDDFLRALRERTTEPVFVERREMPRDARTFTTRRSMTRPGWVRNIWREIKP